MHMLERVLNPILADVRVCFGFLLAQGYELREKNVNFWSLQNWSVTLVSPQLKLRLLSHQFTVLVVLAPPQWEFDNRIELGGVIYYLSEGKEFVGPYEGNYEDQRGQMRELAELLQGHFEEILNLFQPTQFEAHRSALLAACKEHALKYMKKALPWF